MSFQILNPDYSFTLGEIYYANWKKYHQGFESHKKGSLEIDYILSGDCYYTIQGKDIHLKKNHILIHSGDIPHDYSAPASCLNLSIICFQEMPSLPLVTLRTFLEGYSSSMEDLLSLIPKGLVIQSTSTLRNSLMDLYNYSAFSDSLNPVSINIMLSKVLIELINSKKASSKYINQVKTYIQLYFFSIKNIEEIAEHVSLNKIYLQKIFHKETGFTIWNYLNNVRLDKATYYLKDTKVPIGDIDELIGLNSRQNFYLLFRNRFHMSPSEYRKKYRKT